MWKQPRKACGAGYPPVDKNVDGQESFKQERQSKMNQHFIFYFSTEKCCQLELMFEEIDRMVAAM